MNVLRDEEKRTALHIEDLLELSEKHNKPYYSDFLNELQVSAALNVLAKRHKSDYVLWGGYENADRVMLCMYPPYQQPQNEDFPIKCLSVKYRKNDVLTHRDFLGALMSLGLKRDVIGDIVVGEGISSFFVKSELANHITAQIEKIGRVGVVFTDIETVDFDEFSQETEDRECTVSSLRLDSVVAAMTRLSREKVKAMITGGLTVKNHKIVYAPDSKVQSSDKISIRGYGKFIVEFDGSVSKKGKYKILIKKLK